MTILEIDGIYEHVKTGNLYRLLHIAKDSKNLKELAIYEAQYDNKVSKVWVRTKEEFQGEAISPDGTMHPRFRLIEK